MRKSDDWDVNYFGKDDGLTKPQAQADGKDDHPSHTPYKRDNKGNMRNSIVIDGSPPCQDRSLD